MVSAIRSVHTLKENLSRICRRENHFLKRKCSEEYGKVINSCQQFVEKKSSEEYDKVMLASNL